jgi:hypothetical protein
MSNRLLTIDNHSKLDFHVLTRPATISDLISIFHSYKLIGIIKTIIQIIAEVSDNQVTCEIFKSHFVYSIFFYLFLFVIFKIKSYLHKIFFINNYTNTNKSKNIEYMSHTINISLLPTKLSKKIQYSSISLSSKVSMSI